jgi:DNA-binding NarL/FixJ family response regulator
MSPVKIEKYGERNADMRRGRAAGIKAALVDCYGLSRDCIISAIEALEDGIEIVPFSSIYECINPPHGDLNIIVYYCHEDASTEQLTGQEVTTLRQAYSDIPIIVLSDTKQASLAKLARAVIRSGARGFISTRTIAMRIVPASIRYVMEGGTVMPVDVLFSDKAEYEEPIDHDMTAASLTSRQMTVLGHLRQGKPNKIIAHDLRMSESTVKVHIRNIMRKMGATNRTQVVYKAHHFSDGHEADSYLGQHDTLPS